MCSNCNQNKICYAFAHKKQDELPIKKRSVIINKRYFNYYVFSYKDTFLVKKRGYNDVWGGLYEFYNEEKKKLIKEACQINNNIKLNQKKSLNKVY